MKNKGKNKLLISKVEKLFKILLKFIHPKTFIYLNFGKEHIFESLINFIISLSKDFFL